MTNEDIARLAQIVYELNTKFEDQTDASETQLTHSVLMHGNGDDMTVEFLGQIIYSSAIEKEYLLEDISPILHQRIRSVLASLKLLQL